MQEEIIPRTDLQEVIKHNPTPLFVYAKGHLRARAAQLMSLQLPYGLTVRYAVKANPHPEIINIFLGAGLSFDACSSYEASMLLAHNVPGERISLSSQQPPHNLPEMLESGVHFVATSMHQLRLFTGSMQHGPSVGLRVNPGIGGGHNNRNTTGGVNSSFGLWHEYIDEALALTGQHGVLIDRLHVHLGSGSDPAIWGKAMDTALALVARMPDVTSLDIGGGYKIHRSGDEHETDMVTIAQEFSTRLAQFCDKTGRKIHLEIEPGTWLVGHAGLLVAHVVDIVDTGSDGHTFLRLNTGMNDIIRPSMYGAQHRITVLNESKEKRHYVIVGHNCETGDILTPAPGNPEDIGPRELPKVSIGDAVVIHDAGAYCASWSTTGYNGFPSATEIVV